MPRIMYAILSAILVSCAGLNRPSEHVIKGAKLTPYGGFHSLSHDSKKLRMGWNTKGEKWSIEAWVLNIEAAPASLDAFKNLVKENEVIFKEKETYEVLDYEINGYPPKGGLAVLSKLKVKDKSADPGNALLSAYELSCIHPTEKGLGYNVMISRRGNSIEPDSTFDNLAMKILDSFTFIKP